MDVGKYIPYMDVGRYRSPMDAMGLILLLMCHIFGNLLMASLWVKFRPSNTLVEVPALKFEIPQMLIFFYTSDLKESLLPETNSQLCSENKPIWVPNSNLKQWPIDPSEDLHDPPTSVELRLATAGVVSAPPTLLLTKKNIQFHFAGMLLRCPVGSAVGQESAQSLTSPSKRW